MSQGTFCALPVRPFWYRLALSWVPRYLIFITILGVYIAIYIYITRTFGAFDTTLRSGSYSCPEFGTPKNTYQSQETWSASAKRGFPLTVEATRPSNARAPTVSDIAMEGSKNFHFPSSTKNASHGISSAPSEPVLVKNHFQNQIPIFNDQHQRQPSDPLSEARFRIPTLREALNDPDLVIGRSKKPSPDPNRMLRKRHKAIRRQLRYMFVYPAFYFLMWIPLFINHCYFYTRLHSPPYMLTTFAIAFLNLQCAVDCLIFILRETPWRFQVESKKRSRERQAVITGADVELRPLRNERDTEIDTSMRSNQEANRDGKDVAEVLNARAPRNEKQWWDEEGLGTLLSSNSFYEPPLISRPKSIA